MRHCSMPLRALVSVLLASAAGLAQAQFGININSGSVSIGGSHGGVSIGSDGSASASVYGAGGSASMNSSGGAYVSGRHGSVAVDGQGGSSASAYGRGGSVSMGGDGSARVRSRHGEVQSYSAPPASRRAAPPSPSEDWCTRRRAQGVIC